MREWVRYIHLNPLRTGWVKDLEELKQYPYAGHSALMGKGKNDWQDVGYVLGYFGSNVRVSRRCYSEYVKRGIAMGKRSDLVGGGLIRSVGGWTKAKALVKRRGSAERRRANSRGQRFCAGGT